MIAACGNISRKADQAGEADDAGIRDAGVDTVVISPQAREVVSGAGRLSGATYRFDIEIGHAVSQRKTSGVTYTLEGNTTIKP